MVDLVKAVQEAVDRRKAAAILRHHPVLAPYVTEDCQLQPGVTFENRNLVNRAVTTLGPIRLRKLAGGVDCFVTRKVWVPFPIPPPVGPGGRWEDQNTWYPLDIMSFATNNDEYDWRRRVFQLFREIDQCSP